ncbi:DUF6767 domain-containing protein [Micromonospora gifhornensis]|uniref:DUF6767 domain-containing protein n=1 Tax=Micromonospora TaxID=1873 RepID=UPI003452ECE7
MAWSPGVGSGHHGVMTGRRPDARCPLRPGQPCTLCQLDVTGPQDCPLVYLVMTDEELRAGTHRASTSRSALAPATSRRSASSSPA